MDLGKLFDKISGIINSMERAFIDLLSALVPYAVPIIPAYLTYYHTLDAMNFPEWVAKTTAFVVEVLGIASVSTAIRFYENNKRYKDKSRHAPFWLALFTYVFYLTVVLVVNVLLEVDAAQRRPVIIWAIALFSLLSVPSGVLISIRSQFTEMLENKKTGRTATRIQSVLQPMNLDVPFGEKRTTIKKTCVQCGKDFVTTYPNKITCSDACRKAKSRNKSRNVP